MLTNTREIEIEWGDCDAAGIVFYPRYFAYFDASTGRLFEKALGEKKPGWVERFGIVGIPMVDTRARFHIPSRHGDVVTIESRMTACRRSSFDIEHRLMRNGKLAVEGYETRVWTGRDPTDPERIRSLAIPDEVVRAFGIARS
ncbi:MAG TPA: acyl-CoA thioesterase [Devosiaceae bacterium]